MKNNILIKILLVSYIAVGMFGVVRYLALIKQPSSPAPPDAVRSSSVHSGQEETIPADIDANHSADHEAQTDSYHDPYKPAESENIPPAQENEFILDDWLTQIDDFMSKVENQPSTNSDADINSESENVDSADSDNNFNTFIEASAHPVIIDTDFASDADDVVAVRLAMCFQDMGLVDIRGIALSTTYSRSPLALHALCSHDGYGDIPVAMDTSGNGVQVHTDYVDVMYDMPKKRTDYEQPVEMYRRILSESDTKVSIITLGFLQNIQALMASGPDKYSPLTGMELIEQKTSSIYIVGGNSTGKPSFNFYWTGEKVINAAKTVVRDFPARIVFLQTDLSDDTYCGQLYSSKDSRQRDIVTKALKANNQDGGIVAWDVFSVWCAVQDMNGNSDQAFLKLERGTQYISNTGATEWTADSAGRHFKMYKTVEGAYYSEIMNNMLLQKYNSTQ